MKSLANPQPITDPDFLTTNRNLFMYTLNEPGKFQDRDLIEFDQMMIEAITSLEKTSQLANAIWSDVLADMARRELVTLVSGSFDDIGNATINRNYAS